MYFIQFSAVDLYTFGALVHIYSIRRIQTGRSERCKHTLLDTILKRDCASCSPCQHVTVQPMSILSVITTFLTGIAAGVIPWPGGLS